MNKKIIIVVKSLLMICSAVILFGCKQKNKTPSQEEMVEINAKAVADKASAEARKPVPPIDPSICKDNPEGYLYFAVGAELFRVNKDSPLIIGGVFPVPDEHDRRIESASETPKGCKDNPLKAGNNGDFYFERNYKVGRDDLLIEADRQGLRLIIDEVPQQDYESITSRGLLIKDLKWQERDKDYRAFMHSGSHIDYTCQDIAEDLTHCQPKDLILKKLQSKSGLYVANALVASSVQNIPFVFECHSAIPEVKCEAFYRLYPTVNLEYSIRYKQPENFDPKSFLPFDKFLRQMYEAMRVKK